MRGFRSAYGNGLYRPDIQRAFRTLLRAPAGRHWRSACTAQAAVGFVDAREYERGNYAALTFADAQMKLAALLSEFGPPARLQMLLIRSGVFKTIKFGA